MNYKKIIGLYFFCIVSLSLLWGQSGKADIHIIIDTDCGADDLRAISLMLASPRINIHGFISSDGALSPKEGVEKIKGLLSDYYHQGIPVVEGYTNLLSPPPFRQICSEINWGTNNYIYQSSLSPDQFIKEITEREKIQIQYVCLGSLHNIWEIIQKSKNIKASIKKIIWFNGTNNTNYNFSPLYADSVLQCGLTVETISSNGFEITNSLLQLLEKNRNAYAGKIIALVNQISLSHRQIMIWDDFVSIYLLHPEWFSKNADYKYVFNESLSVFNSFYAELTDIEKIKEGKVFDGFPLNQSLYAEDVQQIMHEIIEKYGIQEWRAGVITNELHGHLGIYAIIGTKMGLRVREYFHTGVDDIKIISYAGSIPPVSCMNDGLQVSTGGTLGHGLISIDLHQPKQPLAMFTFRGQTIEVSVKKEYCDKIKNDIVYSVQHFGLNSNEYWLYVRKLALQYWKDWDRHQIFNIKVIEP